MYSNSRWWENYLVRYFMPSVAGMLVVVWLSEVAGNDFKDIIFLKSSLPLVGISKLILLFLYGNLFCYVASYPVLTFHVTRVLDFSSGSWLSKWHDGYIVTSVFAILCFSVTLFFGMAFGGLFVFMFVAIFVFIQAIRIMKAMKLGAYSNLKDEASCIYGYLHSLSVRRGGWNKKDTSTSGSGGVGAEKFWRRELVDSYRHMREHGNSAFIFTLELILAALCYPILASTAWTGLEKLAILGCLLFLWGLPAMFVHMVAQSVESRFSHYDRKLDED